MNKLLAALNVLRYGASVANPATLKVRQNLVNALTGLLGALFVFLPIEVTADDLANIAGGIAAVVGLFNVYATVASTNKIGLRTQGSAPGSGVQSGEGELPGVASYRQPFDNIP